MEATWEPEGSSTVKTWSTSEHSYIDWNQSLLPVPNGDFTLQQKGVLGTSHFSSYKGLEGGWDHPKSVKSLAGTEREFYKIE